MTKLQQLIAEIIGNRTDIFVVGCGFGLLDVDQIEEPMDAMDDKQCVIYGASSQYSEVFVGRDWNVAFHSDLVDGKHGFIAWNK